MEQNALYFPYIRVPKSVWFTRMLLYWDSVSTIVPIDFLEKPEALGKHTRELFVRELVKPISPGSYIDDIPAFGSAFADYLHGSIIDIGQRCRRFEKGNVSLIHIEKMGPISDLLIGLDLAREKKSPWFFVEHDTATEFMTYLAGCLGKVPEINAMPVTDEEANLQVFLRSERGQDQATRELNYLRMEVLEKVFPAPTRSLTATEIEAFKMKYGGLLRSFRRAVEQEIIVLAQSNEPAHRQRRLELFEDEIHEIAEDLNARFREGGFVNVSFGKLCPLIGAIPGVPFVFGLASAVYKAFGGGVSPTDGKPLAYAAYAQVDLLAQADEV